MPKKEDEMKLWSFFQHIYKNNVSLILPNDPVDSYELAKKSDINFVYHSSIGAEIMALGKNIYSLNSCRYDYLYGCTLVNNIQHLSKIISASLASEQQTFDENISRNGLEYLYSATHFGEKYSFYEAESSLSGTFMGLHL